MSFAKTPWEHAVAQTKQVICSKIDDFGLGAKEYPLFKIGDLDFGAKKYPSVKNRRFRPRSTDWGKTLNFGANTGAGAGNFPREMHEMHEIGISRGKYSWRAPGNPQG